MFSPPAFLAGVCSTCPKNSGESSVPLIYLVVSFIILSVFSLVLQQEKPRKAFIQCFLSLLTA